MHIHPNSPAEKMQIAIRMATEALDQMERRGASQASRADAALALRRMVKAFNLLPQAICDANTGHCEGCHHRKQAYIDNTLADGYATRDDYVCDVSDVLTCPAVNACGFLSDDDAALMVPPFLRKQAE